MSPEELRVVIREVLAEQDDILLQHEARATQRAIEATLAVLGIDYTDPKDVRDFQEVIAHSRLWMKNVRKFQTVGVTTMITILVGGLMSAIWLGFRGLVK